MPPNAARCLWRGHYPCNAGPPSPYPAHCLSSLPHTSLIFYSPLRTLRFFPLFCSAQTLLNQYAAKHSPPVLAPATQGFPRINKKHAYACPLRRRIFPLSAPYFAAPLRLATLDKTGKGNLPFFCRYVNKNKTIIFNELAQAKNRQFKRTLDVHSEF